MNYTDLNNGLFHKIIKKNRKRLYEIMEKGQSGDTASNIFDFFYNDFFQAQSTKT